MKSANLAIGLLLVSAFLGWQAYSLNDYIQKEHRPPAWDQAVHMEIALDYHQAIQQGRWTDVWTLPPKPGMPPFPPLYHLALMHAYDWSPENPTGAALWLNWIYLTILCLSLFGIAWEMGLQDRAWAVACAFAAAPVIQSLCRTQLIDLGVAAWVAAAYWAYLRSKEFLRWPSSIAFGLIYAIGMLHKWSFFAYLLPIYWWSLKAFVYPETRRQAMAAWVIALAGFLPWYLIHLPVLLPRLGQAASDFAVPFWKGDALLQYLYQMPAQLGPPLFACGCIALIVPPPAPLRYDKRILLAFFVMSYVLWAIVPNRQFRFLLPGLVGFSVMACISFPRFVVWLLAAFQIFSAANYSAAWVPAIAPDPAGRILFFPSQLPSGDQWPIRAILEKAEKLRPKDAPFSNLTLVANDERFNGPTVTWMTKWLGLTSIKIRGVNSRLCEFSRFVLLKTGPLGPPSVIGGLPEAAKVVQDPHGWFARAYQEEARWRLPDRSEAVLYGLRPLQQPPFAKRSLHFRDYHLKELSAKNLQLDLRDWDASDSAYRDASISAEAVSLRGLELSRAHLEMDQVEAVPVEESPMGVPGDLRLLKMQTLHVRSLEISAQSLARFIEARVPGLKIKEFKIAGTLSLRGSYRFMPVDVEAAARKEDDSRRLAFEFVAAKIGGMSVPMGLLGSSRRIYVSLEPNPEIPFRVDLAGLTLRNDRVSIP